MKGSWEGGRDEGKLGGKEGGQNENLHCKSSKCLKFLLINCILHFFNSLRNNFTSSELIHTHTSLFATLS